MSVKKPGVERIFPRGQLASCAGQPVQERRQTRWTGPREAGQSLEKARSKEVGWRQGHLALGLVKCSQRAQLFEVGGRKTGGGGGCSGVCRSSGRRRRLLSVAQQRRQIVAGRGD